MTAIICGPCDIAVTKACSRPKCPVRGVFPDDSGGNRIINCKVTIPVRPNRISMDQAQRIRTLVADLDDFPCLRTQGPEGRFLPAHAEDVRAAAWTAALDAAEGMIRAQLRELGVEA
jgi:hypothetical protein